MSEKVYGQDDFYTAFYRDCSRARALVVIQSAFLSQRRINDLLDVLHATVTRGVRVCVFTQLPRDGEKDPDSADMNLLRASIKILTAIGVHVTVRRRVHEKVIVIDDHILYDGSMNILSHLDTSERMTRWDSKWKVEEATVRHKLDSCDYCNLHPAFSHRKRDQVTLADRAAIVGWQLAQRRRTLLWSQRELAEFSGVLQRTITVVERGANNVKLYSLIKLAESLGLEVVLVPHHVLPAVGRVVQFPKME